MAQRQKKYIRQRDQGLKLNAKSANKKLNQSKISKCSTNNMIILCLQKGFINNVNIKNCFVKLKENIIIKY